MNSIEPFISIITPVYNRASLIGRAIASVQAQTFTQWELLVVDDGSGDDTAEIVSRLETEDGRIRLYRSEHIGAAAARNRALAYATGEWVTFLDSDDEYLHEHLQQRAGFVVAHPELDMIHGGVEIIGDPFVPDMNDTSKSIHIADCSVGGTFMIRRRVLQAVGGFPEVPYGEDAALMERLMEQGIAIERVPWETYRYYRNGEDSTCNTVGI